MAPTFSSEPAALLAEPLTTDASSSASSSLVGLSHLHPPTTLILDANANAFRREGADHTWIWMICVLLAVTAHAIYNFGFLRKFDRLRDAPAAAHLRGRPPPPRDGRLRRDLRRMEL